MNYRFDPRRGAEIHVEKPKTRRRWVFVGSYIVEFYVWSTLTRGVMRLGDWQPWLKKVPGVVAVGNRFSHRLGLSIVHLRIIARGDDPRGYTITSNVVEEDE